VSFFGGRAIVAPTMRVAITNKKNNELKSHNIFMTG
jgi:hypothetical protein